MAFQSAPNCAEAVIRCSYSAKEVVNVLNFHFHSGSYSQSDINALANVVDTDVDAFYKAALSNNVTYVETFVRGLTDETDLSAADSTGAGAGSVTGGSYPANVAACISLGTGFTGRSNRGRFYALPTGTSNGLGVNTVSTTYLAQLTDFLEAVKGDAAAIGWDFVVLSRFHDGSKRATATHQLITSITARNQVLDSQRGRLPKGH